MGLFDRKSSDLIRKYEGYDSNAYQLDNEDFHTIGYGSTSYQDGYPDGANDTITKQAAHKLLIHHIDSTKRQDSQIVRY